MAPNFKWKNHKFACEYSEGINDAYCSLREKSATDLGFCTEIQCPTFGNEFSLKKGANKGWKVTTYIISSQGHQSIVTNNTVKERTLSEIISDSLIDHSDEYREIKLSITPR